MYIIEKKHVATVHSNKPESAHLHSMRTFFFRMEPMEGDSKRNVGRHGDERDGQLQSTTTEMCPWETPAEKSGFSNSRKPLKLPRLLTYSHGCLFQGDQHLVPRQGCA